MNHNVPIPTLTKQTVIEPPRISEYFSTTDLESYFSAFRNNIIGIEQTINTPYGKNMPLLYADWTASGRGYQPIEDRIQHEIMPYMANTHTETTTTGNAMTYAYHESRSLIKQHVNGGKDDVLVMTGAGTTAAVNKLQRMMGLKIHPSFRHLVTIHPDQRPVVFITHMEHHSNHTSWLETIAEVVIIQPTAKGQIDLEHLKELLHHYRSRPMKLAAVTACSNVTGLYTPYHQIAQLMHQADGYCLVDFAAAAPYLDIDMHPATEGVHLDAIYFSPHKFLGGSGSSGVLVFNQALYQNTVPDHPGGGTVDWTNPWGVRKYVEDIEAREDGGTPAILQTIRTALCLQLKNTMGVHHILRREQEQLAILWPRLARMENLRILAGEHTDRLGIISFLIEGLPHAVGVRMLNDHFGIQARGGCSCAGTYGHYLLGISQEKSEKIAQKVDQGYSAAKPGWIRLSLHPTMTNQEVHGLADSLEALSKYHSFWVNDYSIDNRTGTPTHQKKSTDTLIKRKIHTCLTRSFG